MRIPSCVISKVPGGGVGEDAGEVGADEGVFDAGVGEGMLDATIVEDGEGVGSFELGLVRPHAAAPAATSNAEAKTGTMRIEWYIGTNSWSVAETFELQAKRAQKVLVTPRSATRAPWRSVVRPAIVSAQHAIVYAQPAGQPSGY
jgi:hypothetical protein